MEVSPRLVRRTPDMQTALQAIQAASDLIDTASVSLEQGDHLAAFNSSRDAMRIAASALLFKDGYVVESLDATTEYLRKRYPDSFRFREWHWVETTVTGHGPGLLNMLIKATGNETGEREAKRALDIAISFIEKAKELVYI